MGYENGPISLDPDTIKNCPVQSCLWSVLLTKTSSILYLFYAVFVVNLSMEENIKTGVTFTLISKRTVDVKCDSVLQLDI